MKIMLGWTRSVPPPRCKSGGFARGPHADVDTFTGLLTICRLLRGAVHVSATPEVSQMAFFSYTIFSTE